LSNRAPQGAINADDTQARTGSYATFRLAEGPSQGLTTVPGVNPTTVQRNNSTIFLQIFYKVNFAAILLGAEFALRVDSIVLTI
jgi:hypothetical protein